MSDIEKKLASLSKLNGLMTGAQWKEKATEKAEEETKVLSEGGFEIDSCVPGEVHGSEDFGFYLARQDFPLDTQHGNLTLGDGLNVEGRHISLSAADDELADFDPRKAVFIDTETTGLMGGTGTVAFLIGVGYFIDDVFRLDQCFMRDYDDEEPMLEYLDALFKNADTVVSFNGKSFDVPLMRTRFITNRVPYRLEGKLHFDLVHASRRFWKQRLGDCSLGNIEQEIMGIQRHGDVPSYMIPQLWLDYVYSRDARELKGVFYHHQMDILSLAALTGHLSQCIDQPDGEGFEHHEDRLSLMRIHFKQKKYNEVLQLSDKLLSELTQTGLRHECFHMCAMAAKRSDAWVSMETFWKQCLTEFPRDISARIELAKHYEHRAKDLPKAAKLCEDALAYIETRVQLTTNGYEHPQQKSLQHRFDRIKKKLS